MATSGSYAFFPDIAELVTEAYERVGLPADKIFARHLLSARFSLNLLLLDWVNDQINLWAVAQHNFTTTQGDDTEILAEAMSDVLDVYLRRDGIDTPMVRISRDEYAALPNKTDQGRPHHFFIERFSTFTRMTLWQVPENSTDVVYYYGIRQLEEAGDFEDDPDIQHRFYDALCAGLAYRLAPKAKALGFQPLTPTDLSYLKLMYDEAYDRAKSDDRERTATKIVPRVRRSW